MRGLASYPHPVLGNQDDVQVEGLSPAFAYEILDEKVSLDVEGLKTGNKDIDDLVQKGKAEWIVRIQCAATYYRTVRRVKGPETTIHLDGRDLSGRVDVDFQLAAKEPVPGYRPEGMHPDYGDASFDLRLGDVLATGGKASFSVDKDFDPLIASVQSIMRVTMGEHQSGPYRVDLGDELIEVYLSKDDWQSWNAVKEHAPGFLHASVVVPALMTALQEYESHAGQKWADRLAVFVDNVHQIGKQVDSGIGMAQFLLGGEQRAPLTRGMAELLTIIDEE